MSQEPDAKKRSHAAREIVETIILTLLIFLVLRKLPYKNYIREMHMLIGLQQMDIIGVHLHSHLLPVGNHLLKYLIIRINKLLQ